MESNLMAQENLTSREAMDVESSLASSGYVDLILKTPKVGQEQEMLVFSHLRWDFVFQRPQHLMSRFAKDRRVFFIEEPVFENTARSFYEMKNREGGVKVIVPHLPQGLDVDQVHQKISILVEDLIQDQNIQEYVSWYYTPMALEFTRHLTPSAIIFDCMDELSAFKNAPQSLLELEAELLRKADVVFTGGTSLYEAKRDRHHNVHAFPSSIDREHFMKARLEKNEPDDQASIPHPRIGFFGVIDERMDIELVGKMAQLRPDWHFVMIGPVVKIDPATLPQSANIHYLGKKDYKELPSYLSGWDVAMLPFARNESTRFISPTKTPEYLAAGRPVVSTSIRDVIRPYQDEKLVLIADQAEDFVASCEKALIEMRHGSEWLDRVDIFLGAMSWDSTFARMSDLVRASYDAQFKTSSPRKASLIASSLEV